MWGFLCLLRSVDVPKSLDVFEYFSPIHLGESCFPLLASFYQSEPCRMSRCKIFSIVRRSFYTLAGTHFWLILWDVSKHCFCPADMSESENAMNSFFVQVRMVVQKWYIRGFLNPQSADVLSFTPTCKYWHRRTVQFPYFLDVGIGEISIVLLTQRALVFSDFVPGRIKHLIKSQTKPVENILRMDVTEAVVVRPLVFNGCLNFPPDWLVEGWRRCSFPPSFHCSPPYREAKNGCRYVMSMTR